MAPATHRALRHPAICAIAAITIASCSTDTSTVDAASAEDSAIDAGHDAYYAAPDSGPLAPGLAVTNACTDLAATLYLTPAGLSPFSVDVRGTLLGCAHLATITPEQLRARLASVPDAVITGGNVESYLIAYRTEREPRGVGGISTALVYVPELAIGDLVPMVLGAHGSVGVDDHCAPSHLIDDPSSFLPADYMDAFLLAWAARGLPVVVPDYAGLGTEGVHGYGNWLDPARSAIDGVRALRSILPSDRLDGTTLVYGHSQGGGVALTVAALASEAPDVSLAAVVAFAPGYRFLPSVQAIGASTIALTPALREVVALSIYADYANLTPDETHWGDPFAASLRDPLVHDTSTLCYGELLTALDTASAGYTPPRDVAELLDSTFASDVNACASGGACTGLVGAWVARDTANDPHLPSASPPVLFAGSMDDEQVTIGQFGCVIDRVVHDGITPDVCVVNGPTHLGVVTTMSSYGIEWALAAHAGNARPPCAGSTAHPHCRLL